MELNIGINRDDLFLPIPNSDPSDAESGIGSLPGEEDLGSLVSSILVSDVSGKLKRRVQFKSEDNLVLIKEIPPRGFYGSEDSTLDSGAEDDDDDSSEEESDEDDYAEDSDDTGSNNDDNDAAENETVKICAVRNQAAKGPYSFSKSPSNVIHTHSKITNNNSLLDNKQKKKTRNANNNNRRVRILNRNQRSLNVNRRCTETKASTRVTDEKKRKCLQNSSSVLRSTSSSRNKDIKIRPQTANSTCVKPVSPKYPTLKNVKTTSNRITIHNPSVQSESNLYDFSNPTFINRFIFPTKYTNETGYLPDIDGTSRIDYKPLQRHRQYNAWQVANGNLDGKLFHTPYIAPLWENVHLTSMEKFKQKS